MNSLYVLQSPLTTITVWENPPIDTPRIRWNDKMYNHPDTRIFVARTRNRRTFHHPSLDYAIMNALQDAHMSVGALQKQSVKRREKKPGCKSCSITQLSLFGD